MRTLCALAGGKFCPSLSGIALVGSACLARAHHRGMDGDTIDVVGSALSLTILKNKPNCDTRVTSSSTLERLAMVPLSTRCAV